jgi:DNA-binding GntR family transcriptional regulator
LIDACWRYRKVYVLTRATAFGSADVDHRIILEACAARDHVGAADALARHLAKTALTLLAAADPAYDPVVVRTATQLATGSKSTSKGT